MDSFVSLCVSNPKRLPRKRLIISNLNCSSALQLHEEKKTSNLFPPFLSYSNLSRARISQNLIKLLWLTILLQSIYHASHFRLFGQIEQK